MSQVSESKKKFKIYSSSSSGTQFMRKRKTIGREKMQKLYGILLLSSTLVILSEAFIVPQEIPSLLSLVYSNIPPIKKGTDSRIGFGYRFGDHADFQIQWELGPQKETQPIGDVSSQSKRNIRPSDEYQLIRTIRKEEKLKYETTTSKGWLSDWIDNIRKGFSEAESTTKKPEALKTPRISASALHQLQKLYESAGQNTTNNETPKSENSSTTEGPMSVHHLPKAALDILQQPNSPLMRFENTKNNKNNKDRRSKEKIDSITRDLSNVDLD